MGYNHGLSGGPTHVEGSDPDGERARFYRQQGIVAPGPDTSAVPASQGWADPIRRAAGKRHRYEGVFGEARADVQVAAEEQQRQVVAEVDLPVDKVEPMTKRERAVKAFFGEVNLKDDADD